MEKDNFFSREGIRFMRYIGKGQKIDGIPMHPTTGFYLDEYFYPASGKNPG